MKRVILGVLAVAMFCLVLSAGFCFAADTSDMTGTWELDVRTPSGSGMPLMVLKQDGNKLSGSYSGQLGETDVTGAIKGNKWHVEFNSAGIDIKYSGKVTGDKVKGSVDLGPYGMGTFTGERKK